MLPWLAKTQVKIKYIQNIFKIYLKILDDLNYDGITQQNTFF